MMPNLSRRSWPPKYSTSDSDICNSTTIRTLTCQINLVKNQNGLGYIELNFGIQNKILHNIHYSFALLQFLFC